MSVAGVGGGGADDHLAGAGLEVLGRALALREEAGRLDHHVDAEVAPGQRGRVALGHHGHGLAAHRQREAIALLDLELLDPPLRRVAELRMANPSSSLAELGERARPPMTKSAVARHMKTLISLTKT